MVLSTASVEHGSFIELQSIVRLDESSPQLSQMHPGGWTSLQLESVKQGTNKISLDEINLEINTVRENQKQ